MLFCPHYFFAIASIVFRFHLFSPIAFVCFPILLSFVFLFCFRLSSIFASNCVSHIYNGPPLTLLVQNHRVHPHPDQRCPFDEIDNSSYA